MSDDKQERERTIYLSREQMLAVREQADNRDQPWALYEGQRIIGFTEWKTGSLHMPGIWCALIVLAAGTRLQVHER